MKLLQSQKNQLYKTVEQAGLSPNLFDLKEETPTTFLIFKENRNYFFAFKENARGSHYAKYSPGSETLTEEQNPGSWDLQLGYFRQWLGYLKRELSSQNLWEQLQAEIDDTNFGDIKYDNSKFSYQEFKTLEQKIEDLKNKISKLDIVEEKINAINTKLDHLLNMAKDLNKTDWKELFVGSVISLIMQLSIDKQTGQTIFGFVRTLFVALLPSGV